MKMRFGITWKMFLAVLIACLVILVTMGYAIRVSFENGFLHYVRERDAGRIKAVMAKVTNEYATHGNWNFLRDHPAAWVALVDAAIQDALHEELDSAQIGKRASWHTFPGSGSVQQLLGPLSGPSEGPHWGMRLPPAPPAASSIMMDHGHPAASDSPYASPPVQPPHDSTSATVPRALRRSRYSTRATNWWRTAGTTPPRRTAQCDPSSITAR